MTGLDRRTQALAVCLSALAGYVDAVGFLQSGGYFVSFMSGNTTRMAVGIEQASGSAVIAAGLIGSFVLGAILGSLCGALAGTRRRSAVLLLLAAVLAGAAALDVGGARALAIGMTALAMGAENAVFEQPGGGSVGLTYMTGTLAKTGQGIAAMLLGRGGVAWVSHVALWAGLVGGAILGATLYPKLGGGALWVPAGMSLVLAIGIGWFGRH